MVGQGGHACHVLHLTSQTEPTLISLQIPRITLITCQYTASNQSRLNLKADVSCVPPILWQNFSHMYTNYMLSSIIGAGGFSQCKQE